MFKNKKIEPYLAPMKEASMDNNSSIEEESIINLDDEEEIVVVEESFIEDSVIVNDVIQGDEKFEEIENEENQVKKGGLFSFLKKNVIVDKTYIKDTNKVYDVYLISDTRDYKIKYALERNGINVARSSCNISEIKNSLLYTENPYLLIVVETGTGRFTSGGLRTDFFDMLGIGDSSQNHYLMVFHEDKSLKKDTKNKNSIKFKQYRGTMDIINEIKQLNLKVSNQKEEDKKENFNFNLETLEMRIDSKGKEFIDSYKNEKIEYLKRLRDLKWEIIIDSFRKGEKEFSEIEGYKLKL